MLTLVLLAAITADPCVITWTDSHTLTVESYSVTGDRVEMIDRAGDKLVARVDQIDLAATAGTCPPKAAPVKVERRAAIKKPLSLVEAAELAASLPHAGTAGFGTVGSDYTPPANVTGDTTPDSRAVATGDWSGKLRAMRSRFASLMTDRRRTAAEHDRLVAKHNLEIHGGSRAEVEIARQRIADMRTKLDGLDTQIAQLRGEYAAAQEQARTSGAMASAWRDAIDGGTMSGAD